MRTMFVVLNGPSGSGKSLEIMPRILNGLRAVALKNAQSMKSWLELSELMRIDIQNDIYDNVINDSFAAPMKLYIERLLGIPYHEIEKNKPMKELAGYTPRQFLISESEDHMKKRYGQDIFAKTLVARVLRRDDDPLFVVIDDGGFQPEVDALPKRLLIRVERPGKSFEGDSRNYLPDPDFTLVNDGSLTDLDEKCSRLVTEIVNHPKTKW